MTLEQFALCLTAFIALLCVGVLVEERLHPWLTRRRLLRKLRQPLVMPTEATPDAEVSGASYARAPVAWTSPGWHPGQPLSVLTFPARTSHADYERLREAMGRSPFTCASVLGPPMTFTLRKKFVPSRTEIDRAARRQAREAWPWDATTDAAALFGPLRPHLWTSTINNASGRRLFHASFDPPQVLMPGDTLTVTSTISVT